MAFDYKKEYAEFYLPKKKPAIVTIPEMKYLAVRGKGDPNDPDGTYKRAVSALYTTAYTLRMSRKSGHEIEGFFDYVVPPLEGLWKLEGVSGIDYSRKQDFEWTAMIRLPDFVTEEVFEWAVKEASSKKQMDLSMVEYFTLEEGLCVQCMHIGPYDNEPETVNRMDRYLEEQGYENDFSDTRLHHEIYLSDPRRTTPENLRTVIRHPIRKKEL